MLEKQSNVKAWLYLLPALALLSVFTFYPLFNAFLLAFLKDYVYGSATGFVFMDNFKNVIADPNFNQAVKNTSIIVFVSVPISVTVALMISVLLNSIKKFQGLLQTIFFLPYVTNAIAIGMAFAFIFNESYGLLNLMLSWVNIDPVDWLGSWETGMVSLLIYTVWGGLAFKIMVFLSGLQSIDKQYYDAARVDATPKFRVFTRITVPLLSPMIAYITVTSFIGSFKAYRTIVGLFGPTVLPAGTLPDESFITIVGLIYESLSKSDTPGMVSEAAAASILLFITTLAFTIVNMWVSKKRVHF
ncbi:MAG: Lactose transport system permease protein LacF [Candidatus Izimaplasma bacterium HR2]|nr:MAG: Lactose transport system permease protein LacF [Candidatus Izimaplasma bacterium HR2]